MISLVPPFPISSSLARLLSMLLSGPGAFWRLSWTRVGTVFRVRPKLSGRLWVDFVRSGPLDTDGRPRDIIVP